MKQRQTSSGRVGSGLVSLGAAAVVAIYTTGFVRTKSAAARLEAAGRPRVVVPLPAPVTVRSTPPAAPADSRTTENVERVAPTIVAKKKTLVPAPPRETPLPEAATSAPVAAATPAPTPSPTPAITAPTPTPTAEVPATAAPVFKDGIFSGWGTSRHGDIEATVVIKDGRIASAVISKCYTRYPCSRVEHLQAQVVERQSAEVDYVSRATDSADAFYYAVVTALKQAAK